MIRGFPPEGVGPCLALLNACLNFSSFVLIVSAWRAVKRGDRQLHRKLMVSAICVACVFLLSYTIRMLITGSVPYPGGGWPRTLYFWILGSHTILAASLVFFVPRTVFLAIRERFTEHRKLARITFPLWVYVSITGVIVYLMLYQLPVLPRETETATSATTRAATASLETLKTGN